MSDYDDRGAYTPPSDRLAFDPRQPVRGGGPAPVSLIVSGLVLIALVGGVFFLYRDGFKHRGAPPALVGAPVADARTPAPAAQAAADADGAPPGLSIDKTAAPAPTPKFGPPPAQPLPPAASGPTQTAAAAPAAAPAALPPAAKVAAPPQVVMLHPEAAPAAASKSAASPAPKLAAVTPPKVAPATAKVATPPATKLAVVTSKKVEAAAAPRPATATPRQAAAAPAMKLAVAAAPAQRSAPRHAAPMSIASLTDAALAERARGEHATHELNARAAAASSPLATPARRVAVTSDARPAAAPTIAGAAGWVQIGAFSSAALADAGWHDLARLQPAAMAGKGRAVQPFTRDDGAILYRAYVTGFASVSAAQSFCSELRAAGKGCIVK